jgi:hypothetical protein
MHGVWIRGASSEGLYDWDDPRYWDNRDDLDEPDGANSRIIGTWALVPVKELPINALGGKFIHLP